jgi:hypothetical protein
MSGVVEFEVVEMVPPKYGVVIRCGNSTEDCSIGLITQTLSDNQYRLL